MMRPDERIQEGTGRKLVRFVTDQCIPAALAISLHAAQRYGYVALLPLNLVIEKEYGNYAMFLSAVAALVACSTFTRERGRFGVAAFLCTALASLVMVAPFVLSRYGVHPPGLTPMQFSLVATFAYLGFSITVGLLIGGCWSTVVKSFRDPATAY
jgi:hypothetical protein